MNTPYLSNLEGDGKERWRNSGEYVGEPRG